MSSSDQSPNNVELSALNTESGDNADTLFLETQIQKMESLRITEPPDTPVENANTPSTVSTSESEKAKNEPIQNGTGAKPRPSVTLHLNSSPQQQKKKSIQVKKKSTKVTIDDSDTVTDALRAVDTLAEGLSPLTNAVDSFLEGSIDQMAGAMQLISREAQTVVTSWTRSGVTEDGGKVLPKGKAYEVVSQITEARKVPTDYTLSPHLDVLEARILPALSSDLTEGERLRVLEAFRLDGTNPDQLRVVEGLLNPAGSTFFHDSGVLLIGLSKLKRIDHTKFDVTSIFIQASDSHRSPPLRSGELYFFSKRPNLSRPLSTQGAVYHLTFNLNEETLCFSKILSDQKEQSITAAFIAVVFDRLPVDVLNPDYANPHGFRVRYLGLGGRLHRNDGTALRMPKNPLEALYLSDVAYDMNPGFAVFQDSGDSAGSDYARSQHSIENILHHRHGDFLSGPSKSVNVIFEYTKISDDPMDGFALHQFEINALRDSENELNAIPEFALLQLSMKPPDLQRFKHMNRIQLKKVVEEDDEVFMLSFLGKDKTRNEKASLSIPQDLRKTSKYAHLFVPNQTNLRLGIRHVAFIGLATNTGRRPIPRVLEALVSGDHVLQANRKDELGDSDDELEDEEYEDQKEKKIDAQNNNGYISSGIDYRNKKQPIKVLSTWTHDYFCAIPEIRVERDTQSKDPKSMFSLVLPFAAMGNFSLGHLPEPEMARLIMLTPVDMAPEADEKSKLEAQDQEETSINESNTENEEKETHAERNSQKNHRKVTSEGSSAKLFSSLGKGLGKMGKATTEMTYGLQKGLGSGLKGLGSGLDVVGKGLGSGLDVVGKGLGLANKEEAPDIPFVVIAFAPKAAIVTHEEPTFFQGYYRFVYPQSIPLGSKLFFWYNDSKESRFSFDAIQLPPLSEAIDKKEENFIQRNGPPLPLWTHVPYDSFGGVAKTKRTLVPLTNQQVTNIYDESGLGSVMRLGVEISVLVSKHWYFEIIPVFGDYFNFGWCQDSKNHTRLTTWCLDLSVEFGAAPVGTGENRRLLDRGGSTAEVSADRTLMALGQLRLGCLLDTGNNEVTFFKNGVREETLTLSSSISNAFPIIFLEPWSHVQVELCNFKYYSNAVNSIKKNSDIILSPKAVPQLQYTDEQMMVLNYKIRFDEWNKERRPGDPPFTGDIKESFKKMDRDPDPDSNPKFLKTSVSGKRRRQKISLQLLGDDIETPQRINLVMDAHLKQILTMVFEIVDEDCTGLMDSLESRQALHMCLDICFDLAEPQNATGELRRDMDSSYMPSDDFMRRRYKSELSKKDFHNLFFSCINTQNRIKESRKSIARKSIARKSMLSGPMSGGMRNSVMPASKTQMAVLGEDEATAKAAADLTPLPFYRLLLLHELSRQEERYNLLHNDPNARILDGLRKHVTRMLMYVFYPFFFLRWYGLSCKTLLALPLALSYYAGLAPIYFFFMDPTDILFAEAFLPLLLTILLAVRFIEVKLLPYYVVEKDSEMEERINTTKLALKTITMHSFGSEQPELIPLERLVLILDPSQDTHKVGPAKPRTCLEVIFEDLLPLFITIVHCIIPGLVRRKNEGSFFTTDSTWQVLFVEIVFIVVSFLAMIRITRSLTKVSVQYLESNTVFRKLTAITYPPEAFREDLGMFCDLAEDSNAMNWEYLRLQIRDLQVKKTAASFFILAPSILLVLFILLAMIANILLGGEAAGAVSILGAWDSVLLTVYILITLSIITSTNGELLTGHYNTIIRRQHSLVEDMQNLHGLELSNAQKELEMLRVTGERVENNFQRDGITIFGLLLEKTCLTRLAAVMASGSGTVLASVLKTYMAQTDTDAVSTEAPFDSTTLGPLGS